LHDNGGRDIDAVAFEEWRPCLLAGRALEGEGEYGRGVVGGAHEEQGVYHPEG